MIGVHAVPRTVQASGPFTIGLALLLVAGACAGATPVPSSDPQLLSVASPTDSASVLSAVGAALSSERARGVVDRFHCRDPQCVEYDGWSAWMPRVEPLLNDLADAAGAVLVRPDRTQFPPCPWNAGAVEPVGYLAWLPQPVIQADSAVVHVRLTCLDALNSSKWVARRELRYSLAREGATWKIVASSVLRRR